MRNAIDITYDFRSDTPAGKDPDSFSPMLRKYHKLLWSKPLPSGKVFLLDDSIKGKYLYHQSELGEFHLSSDTAAHTFSSWTSMSDIISQIDKNEIETFRHLAYTIGGMVIFPSNRVNGKSTINGARGFHPLIKDRIDLTLECIRRFYQNETSPLSETLERYKSFFELFDNFQGYVEFFLFQDLVAKDFAAALAACGLSPETLCVCVANSSGSLTADFGVEDLVSLVLSSLPYVIFGATL